MSFSVTVHELPGLLMVDGSGEATLAHLCGYMNLAAEIATRTRCKRVVLNLMGVSINLAFTEHLTLGTHAAHQLQGLERAASAVAPRFRTGTSEKAAQKTGLRFQTFTTLEEALAWVRADDPRPG